MSDCLNEGYIAFIAAKDALLSRLQLLLNTHRNSDKFFLKLW